MSPIRIFMTPRDRAVAVTLTNEGDTEVALQADISSWAQAEDGNDQLTPTEDLILAPPIIKLAPRQKQVIRLALLRPADASRQLTYRMLVREVPEVTAAKGNIEVPIALALSMPVFITPPVAKRDVSCEPARGAAGAVEARCRNAGSAYAQIRQITLKRSGADLARFEGGSYVLPGARKAIALEAAAAVAPGAAQMNVMFDDGKSEVFEVSVP